MKPNRAPFSLFSLFERVFLGRPWPAENWKARLHTYFPGGQRAFPMGFPIEWTVLAPDDNGNMTLEAPVLHGDLKCACCSAPFRTDPGWDTGKTGGCRCARCGRAIHQKEAGIQSTADVPACPACRAAVRREILLAQAV